MGNAIETPNHADGEASSKERSAEYKEKKRLAKRIVNAAQESLEDAMRKESELCRRPFEKELEALDRMLEASIMSRRGSTVHPPEEESEAKVDAKHSANPGQSIALVNGGSYADNDSTGTTNSPMHSNGTSPSPRSKEDTTKRKTRASRTASNGQGSPSDTRVSRSLRNSGSESITDEHAIQTKSAPPVQHPTPPSSAEDSTQPSAPGGVPWYMETFDPRGTTVEEEKWGGRDLVRGMSEELSDMDEEALSGLVGNGVAPEHTHEGEYKASPSKAEARIRDRRNASRRKARNRYF